VDTALNDFPFFQYDNLIGMPDGEYISLVVMVVDNGNGIDNVSIYVNNNLEEVVSDPPYRFTHSYQS